MSAAGRIEMARSSTRSAATARPACKAVARATARERETEDASNACRHPATSDVGACESLLAARRQDLDRDHSEWVQR